MNVQPGSDFENRQLKGFLATRNFLSTITTNFVYPVIF